VNRGYEKQFFQCAIISFFDFIGNSNISILAWKAYTVYIINKNLINIVKQTIGLRDWHGIISKALNPVLVAGSMEAPEQRLKKQLSNIMSLDPEEKSASDVEQIYQVNFFEYIL
jgi:hypothetical protein